MQVMLQMRREQRVDRIIGDEPGRAKPARHKCVAKHAGHEDFEERHPDLALLGALQSAVLQPDRGLFDEEADVDEGQCRQNADPQHAAPADVFVEQTVDQA
jgi:hypothetical protein